MSPLSFLSLPPTGPSERRPDRSGCPFAGGLGPRRVFTGALRSRLNVAQRGTKYDHLVVHALTVAGYGRSNTSTFCEEHGASKQSATVHEACRRSRRNDWDMNR